MDFNKVIEANKQNIKNIIRLITKEDNEDLEQEVYVKIWKNSDKYQEKGIAIDNRCVGCFIAGGDNSFFVWRFN